MNDEKRRERRQYTPEKKVKTVGGVLATDIGLSEVCREHGGQKLTGEILLLSLGRLQAS